MTTLPVNQLPFTRVAIPRAASFAIRPIDTAYRAAVTLANTRRLPNGPSAAPSCPGHLDTTRAHLAPHEYVYSVLLDSHQHPPLFGTRRTAVGRS